MLRALHILIIASMVSASPAYPQRINTGQAKKIAQNFFLEKAWQFNQFMPAHPKVKSTYIKEYEGSVLYFIIQYQSGGFVIVSPDEKLPPVLGFSLDGTYDPANLPPALEEWMKGYEEQIIQFQKTSYRDKDSQASWACYHRLDTGQIMSNEKAVVVCPLLQSTWEQGTYYNAFCPEDPAGPSGHAYTGCVATAMAQVMYYFRHPFNGNGYMAYFDPQYDTIRADFGNTTYRWNEMIPWIMGQENTAIAELVFHCGVAVRTSYGASGSGANTSDCVQAMSNHFNYKPSASYYFRSDKNISWKDSLMNNLEQGQPVIYRGGPFWSSHCFVCDGYADTSFFHFNFGWWQGTGNGYYYLDDLTPFHYSFTQGQAGVFNIFPDGDYPVVPSGTTILNSTRGSFSDGSGPLPYSGMMDASWLISSGSGGDERIMLYFNQFETELGHDILTVYDGDNISAPVLGQFSGNVLPPTITSSGNTILVHFVSDQQGPGKGFQAHYTTIGGPYCQAWVHLEDSTGYIYDGSWIIYDYANNSDCYWLIEPDVPAEDSISGITINFSEFETEQGADFLRIYNGPTVNDPLLATLTGNALPAEVASSSKSVLVHFNSNDVLTFPGFMGSYRCIFPNYCNDTTVLTAASGTFGDGSGEKFYNNNTDCYWLISPPAAEHILLSFNNFDIEPGYDWLKVYDPGKQPPEELAVYSGNQVPPPLIFQHSRILLHFHSDHLIKKPGWEANYVTNNLGLDTPEDETDIQLFPNPCSTTLHFRLTLARPERSEGGINDQRSPGSARDRHMTAELYSISGLKIRDLFHGKLTSGVHQFETDISDLPNGLYFLRIQSDNLNTYKKLIISR